MLRFPLSQTQWGLQVQLLCYFWVALGARQSLTNLGARIPGVILSLQVNITDSPTKGTVTPSRVTNQPRLPEISVVLNLNIPYSRNLNLSLIFNCRGLGKCRGLWLTCDSFLPSQLFHSLTSPTRTSSTSSPVITSKTS